MNPAYGICLITYTVGVIAVHFSSSSVRCDCHRLHAVRTPSVVLNRLGFKLVLNFVYVSHTHPVMATFKISVMVCINDLY